MGKGKDEKGKSPPRDEKAKADVRIVRFEGAFDFWDFPRGALTSGSPTTRKVKGPLATPRSRGIGPSVGFHQGGGRGAGREHGAAHGGCAEAQWATLHSTEVSTTGVHIKFVCFLCYLIF